MSIQSKILVIIDSSRFSGVGRQVLQNFKYSFKNNYQYILAVPVVGARETELVKEALNMGIPLQIMAQRFSFDPSILWDAWCKLKREGIGIVETHGYKPCILGIFLKYVRGCRWIHFMHGHTTEDFKVAIYYRLEFFLARFADRVVMVSDEMRRRLVARGLPERKVLTIHNALDPAQFAPVERPLAREDFGVDARDLLIGVVGRLSPEKGPDVFLEAFQILAMEHQEIKALFIGEGPLDDELRQKVAGAGLDGRVIFAGYQTDMAGFYSLIDLLVLPSRSEGLPNVIFEAMFFGVPVVATNVGGVAEIVRHKENGLLVDAENPAKLAAAVLEIFGSESMKRKIVENGRQTCALEFSVEKRMHAIGNLYDDLMN